MKTADGTAYVANATVARPVVRSDLGRVWFPDIAKGFHVVQFRDGVWPFKGTDPCPHEDYYLEQYDLGYRDCRKARTSTVRLPSAKPCRSRRDFTIRLRRPARGRIASVRVYVGAKRVKVLRGDRVRTRIDLRGLPRKRYTVRVVVKTTLGETITERRRYRTCVPRSRSRSATASQLTGRVARVDISAASSAERNALYDAFTVPLALIAIHRLTVSVGSTASANAIGTASAGDLAPDAITQLEGYITDLDGRDELEGSRAVAGFFDPAEPTELAALRSATTVPEFEAAAQRAAGRLARLTHGNASSGIVLFLLDSAGRLACFKMDPADLTRARINAAATGAANAFDITTLQDVLPEPRDLRKGALVPSPSGADVRVVDLTTGPDPAGYWVDFLGALSVRASSTASSVMEAAVKALVSEHVPEPEARRVVATEWTATTTAPDPVGSEDFVRAVAASAGADASRTWDHVRTDRPELDNEHAVIAPAVARKIRKTIDLGDGVKISGAASRVDARIIDEDQDDDGWFVKIRATRKPKHTFG